MSIYFSISQISVFNIMMMMMTMIGLLTLFLALGLPCMYFQYRKDCMRVL